MSKDIYTYCNNLIKSIISGDYYNISSNKNMYEIINIIDSKIYYYYTYIQNGGNLCGFYSLFNLYNFILYLKTKEIKYLNILKSPFDFFVFYKEILNFIFTNLKLEISAKKNLKESGCLERFQFDFILNNYPNILNLFSNDNQKFYIKYTKFFFGFNHFNGTSKEANHLQMEINNFLHNNKTTYNILIILLGIVNHWNILILKKNNRKNKIKKYLLDSRNMPEIFKININDDNEIQNLVNELINRNLSYNRKQPSYAWTTFIKQWIIDMNNSLNIISDILNNKYTIYELILNHMINEFCEIFFQYKNNIENFISVQYHPQYFKDEILKFLNEFKYINKINSLNNGNKFLEIFEKINTYINNEKNKENFEIYNKYKEIIYIIKKNNKLI